MLIFDCAQFFLTKCLLILLFNCIINTLSLIRDKKNHR